MAVSRVGLRQQTINGATSVVVSFPTVAADGASRDPQVGDLAIVALGTTSTLHTAHNDPAGWTKLETVSAGRASYRYKILDAADITAGSVTFSALGGATDGRVFCVILTGHDPVNPINVQGPGGFGSTAAMTWASVDTTVANCLGLLFAFNLSGNTTVNFTPTAPLVEHSEYTGASTIDAHAAYHEESYASAGATGTRTTTASVAATYAIGRVAVAPGGAATLQATAGGASTSSGGAAALIPARQTSAGGSSASSGGAAALVLHQATAGGASSSSGGAAATVVSPPTGAGGASVSSGGASATIPARQASAGGASSSSGGASALVLHQASAGGVSSSSGGAAALLRYETSAGGSSSSSGGASAQVLHQASAGGASTSSGGAEVLGSAVQARAGGASSSSGGARALVLHQAAAGGASVSSGGALAVVTAYALYRRVLVELTAGDRPVELTAERRDVDLAADQVPIGLDP